MKRKILLSVLLAFAFVLSGLALLFRASEFVAVSAASRQEASLRNVAFRRAAWHSSAANYDNTGQLIADGVIGVLSNEVIDTSGTSASNPTYGQMIPGVVNSEWISASSGVQWVYLDFGAMTSLRSITVHWGANYAVDYDIQVSDDARTWETVAGAAGAADSAVETKIADNEGRYLRILCKTSSGANYIISEVEVTGSNNVDYKLDAQPSPDADGSLRLTGGNWTLQRASLVDVGGATLSQAGYDDSGWLPATVPGTAFVSYLNAGAVADPYYDDWQFQASDIFFTADFWYCNSFEIPASQKGRKVYLNFDAINWKVDVWLNGQLLANNLPGYAHSIEGAFTRAKFDISTLANYGGRNYLAVLIHRNKTPGLVTSQGLAEGPLPNGGELGQDNPTIHAAVGWDWLPTIRGRDIGIYNDVTVTYGGAVQLENAWMETDLDVTETSANISAKNLAIGKPVTQPATQSAANLGYVDDNDENTQWIGEDIDGAGFTLDLGKITAINSLQLIWGSEAGGAAAAAEDRHPARFKVQVSDDAVNWRNFDSYAGGEVDTGWFGVRRADPAPGTEEYTGFDISNEVPGPVGIVEVSFGSNKTFPMRIPVPQNARYVRFQSTKRRQVEQQGNRIVPTRVREIRIYKEPIEEVGQSMIRTYALDDSKADLTFRTDVHNYGSEPSRVTVDGVITPGKIRFSKTVRVPENSSREVIIDGIVLDNPELWWPNTYGGQPLYTAAVTVSADSAVQDRTAFKFGVREFTYPIDGNRLSIYCNGTRVLAKGGNWGMDDGLKTDTPEKYDDKMRLHAENNFTMIRNWVGMTNHRAFYEAADKYGILLWDDFWLANPADGPNPENETMFLDNAVDKIKKNRYHAALAIYCGRNESSPPKTLDDGLKQRTQDYDGTRIYFPNSAGDPVGSGGGYSIAAMPNRNNGAGIREYFDEVPYVTLRSECGIPNVPSLESMKKFLPEEKLWPINESWALHDWTYHMNGPANTYMDALQLYKPGAFTVPTDNVRGQRPNPEDPVFVQYKKDVLEMVEAAGRAYTLEEFHKTAQLINYENFKGVYEGLTVKRSNGFLMWMSQSSWPSFMWQTYDWYLDTNAGYFGAKAANQPTHAVWDPRDDAIVLSNMTPKTFNNVATNMKVFDLDGKVVSDTTWDTPTLGPDAYGIRLATATADFAKSPTDMVFIRLTVKDVSGNVLGDTLYWHNRKDYMHYESLNDIPEVRLRAAVSPKSTVAGEIGKGNDLYTVTLSNNSSAPAVQTRIRTISSATGEDILPAFYSDNYFSLMPGESKTVTVEFHPKYLKGGRPVFELSGWNTRVATID
ncbi:MAG: discoidin domain-containing protein [Acidobacteria bacterium]|nr:discoidin domain-containing protein [Acidobacteriota bacterium]